MVKRSVVKCSGMLTFSNSKYKLCLLTKFSVYDQGCLLSALQCKWLKGKLVLLINVTFKIHSYILYLQIGILFIHIPLFLGLVWFFKLSLCEASRDFNCLGIFCLHSSHNKEQSMP